MTTQPNAPIAIAPTPRRPLGDPTSPGARYRRQMGAITKLVADELRWTRAFWPTSEASVLQHYRVVTARQHRRYQAAYIARDLADLPQTGAPAWDGIAETGETIETSLGRWPS